MTFHIHSTHCTGVFNTLFYYVLLVISHTHSPARCQYQVHTCVFGSTGLQDQVLSCEYLWHSRSCQLLWWSDGCLQTVWWCGAHGWCFRGGKSMEAVNVCGWLCVKVQSGLTFKTVCVYVLYINMCCVYTMYITMFMLIKITHAKQIAIRVNNFLPLIESPVSIGNGYAHKYFYSRLYIN